MGYARPALTSALAGLALLASLSSGAPGQTRGTAPQTGTVSTSPVPPVAMPGSEEIVVLLRTTMLTLNDALQTENFTVLRDKAAPAFREANSSAPSL